MKRLTELCEGDLIKVTRLSSHFSNMENPTAKEHIITYLDLLVQIRHDLCERFDS